MLCIVCSRPIPVPIYRDENKLCKSCASHIKLKDNFVNDICTDADLDSVQRQLLNDLNLDHDSDYEAELNYLREAKKAAVLGKEKNFQSLHRTESLNEYTYDRVDKVNEMVKSKTGIIAKECVSDISNEFKRKIELGQVRNSSVSNFQFGDKNPAKTEHKLPQLFGCNQQTKEKVNRRVVISRSVKFSLISVKKSDDSSNQALDGTVACRAVFRPWTHKHKEPDPQFEKIDSVDKSVATKCETLPSMTGNKNPFICPVTFCKNIIPVSDLIKHFKLNHTRVPIVPIDSGVCINFFWETKMDQFGISQCLMLLLNTGKFMEPGYGQFRDCLPIAIMTTKIKLSNLVQQECDREDGRHFYLIWLTAMSPSMEPVFYTITAWSDTDDAPVHIVNTTSTYSVRADQNPRIVYGSGMVMILTSEQIMRLSNKGQDMVKLQVVVH